MTVEADRPRRTVAGAPAERRGMIALQGGQMVADAEDREQMFEGLIR